MRALIGICLTLAGLQTVHAQNKETQELHELNKQFIQEFVHVDTAAHNDIIHPDNFLFIDSTGMLINRDSYIYKCSKGGDAANNMRDFRYADESIRMFGNTAIVIAKTECMVSKGSYWIQEGTRYTDTYIKEHGRWWCVQSQVTKISM